MANDYFEHPIKLQAGTKARAEDVNLRFDNVVAGFEKLPAPHATLSGFSEPVAVGDPTEPDHAISAKQALGGSLSYAADTGAVNAYVVDLAFAPTAYSEGMTITFKAANVNTGASTLNLNSLGVKQLCRSDGTTLAAGDIKAGQLVTVIYNGTKFLGVGAFQGQFDDVLDAAEGYVTDAQGYATAAAGSATTASVHVATAAGHVATAAGHVSTTTTQSGIATTKAGEASVSAAAAAASVLETTAQAVIATTKAGEASVSAAAAAASALEAAAGWEAVLEDEAFASSWNGDVTHAPTKNAVFDKISVMDVSLGLKANLASPPLSGNPTAPTQAAGNNTTRLATTAFVQTAISGFAPLASPALTGTPTVPTSVAGANSNQVANTAFVQGELAAKAPLASPTLTGTPAAPTAAAGTNTTQLATTAFVQANAKPKAVQVFTSSGTYTKTTGATVAIVEVVGGGASGAGAASGSNAGSGGGAGGYTRKLINLSSITTETVTIGAGGSAVGTASNGNNGGTSSFGSHCSATGGVGGLTGTTGGGTTESPGGVGSGGDLNMYGGTGKLAGGSGGDSFFGGSRRRGQTDGAYGAGGAGSTEALPTSGAGVGGIVIVTEY